MNRLLWFLIPLFLCASTFLCAATTVTKNITINVTTGGGGLTPPTQAANAGFSTLAINYDFTNATTSSDPNHTSINWGPPTSNWLDCASNGTQPLHWNYPGGRPCNIFSDEMVQQADPDNPSITVMAWNYIASRYDTNNLGGAQEASSAKWGFIPFGTAPAL
jgi:hypothetical protein